MTEAAKCFICKDYGFYCKQTKGLSAQREVVLTGETSGQAVIGKIEECGRFQKVRRNRRGKERFFK